MQSVKSEVGMREDFKDNSENEISMIPRCWIIIIRNDVPGINYIGCRIKYIQYSNVYVTGTLLNCRLEFTD